LTAFCAIFAVVVLPNGPARAAGDCLAGPNAQPPQGSHWYYRIDGAKRHCWYLGPEGQRVHSAESQARPVSEYSAPLRAGGVGDQPTAFAPAKPPLTPPHLATAADDRAPGGVQEIVQEIRQAAPVVTQWSDPQPPFRARDRDTGGGTTSMEPMTSMAPMAQERATARIEDANLKGDVIRPAAANPRASTITLTWVILLVAGALAVAGIFQHAIVKVVVARRVHLERGRAERYASLSRERTPAAFAPSRPHARPPVNPIDPSGTKEGLRQILQAVEQRAA
jgi:hypothetical protein